jgi:hypothetical protein
MKVDMCTGAPSSRLMALGLALAALQREAGSRAALQAPLTSPTFMYLAVLSPAVGLV